MREFRKFKGLTQQEGSLFESEDKVILRSIDKLKREEKKTNYVSSYGFIYPRNLKMTNTNRD